jgi:hypothetical protein
MILATARHGYFIGPVVGFVASRLINVDGFGTVFHTGLTAVAPDHQSKGFLWQLHGRTHKMLSYRFPSGTWYTSKAAMPKSLVQMMLYAVNGA